MVPDAVRNGAVRRSTSTRPVSWRCTGKKAAEQQYRIQPNPAIV